MRPSYSNQAAEAILRVQGEPVLINGVTTTAVAVRHQSSTKFGQMAKYNLSPSMVLLKVSGTEDAFTNATIQLDGKTYKVSETDTVSFGLINLLCRLSA